MPTNSLLTALTERVIIADGAMGTMLQAQDPSLDDFQGYEGCNEILNVTRPDIVAGVHAAYLDVGVDCVETNTFGANLANLGEYDISDRIQRARAGRRADRPRGGRRLLARRTGRAGCSARSVRAPSCRPSGHMPVRRRCATRTPSRSPGLLEGGVDAVLIETAQDLLQAKAALIGARRAMAAVGSPTSR